MTPVAPVRCPPCETCGQAATGMGISEMRLRGSGNTVHALYAWALGETPLPRVRCQLALFTYLRLRGSGLRLHWTVRVGRRSFVRMFAYSGVTDARNFYNGSTEPPSCSRAAAGDRPCRGHPLGLGVARTRTTRAVADGSTVPLFLCTESFRELFCVKKTIKNLCLIWPKTKLIASS